MRIQVITRNNGYGLTKDVQVIREAMEPHGHTVDFTDWTKPRTKGKWDWNIHLELLNPAHFRTGLVNAFVPNPEWFDSAWNKALPSVDIVLAKTYDTKRIYDLKHKKVVHTGWTSPDPGMKVDLSRRDAIHSAGHSVSKGTYELIEAARMVPELPITLIAKNKISRPVPSNVKVVAGYLSDAEHAELRKAPIHLCPSSYEGFGHYMNEARAMGALLLSTDAEPMNEIVGTESTILVPHCSERTMRHAIEKIVCVDALAEGMRMSLTLLEQAGPQISKAARDGYEKDRALFHERILEVVR
jgi:hypothetical protein